MATESDTTAADNVTPIRPGVAPEQPPRPTTNARHKDRTGAARQAKFRSRNKGDRYERRRKGAPPSSRVDAPPIAPFVTQAARNGVTTRRDRSGSPGRGEPAHVRHGGAAIDLAAYTAAVALAGAAAFFSIKGMVVIFPGSPVPVIGMAIAMEAAKLITAGWLARRWSATAVVWRLALIAFVVGLAVINATGVFAQLVSAHVGERGAATSRIEEQTAEL